MCRCHYSRSLILQRPFPIYELDMNSGNAVSTGAARANGRVRGDAILLADQPDETTLRNLQRREDSCSFCADVFGHCLFTFSYLTVNVDHFQSHIDSNVVPRMSSLIR